MTFRLGSNWTLPWDLHLRQQQGVTRPVRRGIYCEPVTGRFRNLVRATAWLFLAWTAVDLGVPSLCGLDHESEPSRIYSSSALMDARSTNETSPDAPVHVDDCFCCSHCVNVTAMHSPEILTIAGTDTALPSDSAPIADGYPPYHPPRV